jgi:hypothetical protein
METLFPVRSSSPCNPLDGMLSPLLRDHSQHGPAQILGPPYVYSWNSNNNTEMIEQVRIAASTPIDR